MKKSILIILIISLLLVGCEDDKVLTSETSEASIQSEISETTSKEEQKEAFAIKPPPANIKTPKLTKETYPKIDGSTANIPLAQQLAKLFLNISDTEAESMVNFNTTPFAYQNLAGNFYGSDNIKSKCDLLIVYEASEETKQQLRNEKFELYPIGSDALVFIVNENNPVKNLSAQQIKDIYTGKIRNWNDIGGENMEIAAFQRDPTSGSQALMNKLVMKGAQMTEAPKEFKPSEMGMLIDSIAEYNNAGNAIGYSVYYYASLMYTRPGLKFIGVDGVEPSKAAIRSKQYPFTNDFYAVIRANEPENSPARLLAYWLCGEDGKDLIEQCGYVAN